MMLFMKEKLIRTALMLVVGIGTLVIIFIFKVLRLKEEKEQGPLFR